MRSDHTDIRGLPHGGASHWRRIRSHVEHPELLQRRRRAQALRVCHSTPSTTSATRRLAFCCQVFRMYVERWADQSAIISPTGDELSRSRVQPLPRPLSRGCVVCGRSLRSMDSSCTVAVGVFSTSFCLFSPGVSRRFDDHPRQEAAYGHWHLDVGCHWRLLRRDAYRASDACSDVPWITRSNRSRTRSVTSSSISSSADT